MCMTELNNLLYVQHMYQDIERLKTQLSHFTDTQWHFLNKGQRYVLVERPFSMEKSIDKMF